MKRNPVVHFEMPYEDAARVAQFYQSAFGWDMKQFGEDMGNYVTAKTAESDENGMSKVPGTINGGFFPKKSDWPAQYPSIVVSVPNIEEAMTRIQEAGGEVLGEQIMIPGIGKYVSFNDTEGNRASLLQAI
jgi:predicted enzyme related to lactoylglutathione lyase